MEILFIGIAACFNFAIILKKLRMKRTADAILDATIFAVICFLFSGTYGALCAGTVASALFSIYLLKNPFTLQEIAPVQKKQRRKIRGEIR